MISELHSFIKRAFFKTHTKCCHSWDSFASSQHHTSPFVHSFSPGRKIWRYNLFMFRLSICWSFSNVPKESPFCIKGRRAFTLRFILFVVMSKTRTMISCSFNVFRCSSNLVMFLRVNFLYFLSIIEVMSSSCKVTFNHLTIDLVIMFVYSWVFKNHNSIKMKRFCTFLAFLLPSFCLIKEFLSVNCWDVNFHMKSQD